jgi:prepilin-type N-terminal cleavage/methylation domain-containing protein
MTHRPTHNAPRRPGRGFTLIELLAVMLIMAVLISLVVAVGNWVREESARKKTGSIQDVAMQAVQAFHDEVGRYPGIDRNGDVDTDLDDDPPDEPEDDETTAVLLEYLRAERGDFTSDDELENAVKYATRDMLTNLPAGAMQDNGQYLLDGYKQRMHYDPVGGLGGRRPVLISAGADGRFDQKEDNIRSDGG